MSLAALMSAVYPSPKLAIDKSTVSRPRDTRPPSVTMFPEPLMPIEPAVTRLSLLAVLLFELPPMPGH